MSDTRGWQSGDIGAFEALFRQHEKLVLRTAYFLTGTREDAEDIVQEVFLNVWRSRHTFDPERGKLTTWLCRITVNQCMSMRRRKQSDLVLVDDEGVNGVEGGEVMEEAMINKEEYARALQAVKSLDRKHSTVLVLRYFNELSYAEIAGVMNIPLGTVKSRINQGLRLLREQLGVQQGEAR